MFIITVLHIDDFYTLGRVYYIFTKVFFFSRFFYFKENPHSSREKGKERERERISYLTLSVELYTAQSHDPEIMIYAKIKNQMLN